MANPRSMRFVKFSSVFLKLALGISFLSAVADRFGLWGVCGQPKCGVGQLCPLHGLHRHAQLVFAPITIPALALITTAPEILLGLSPCSRLENSHRCLSQRSP